MAFRDAETPLYNHPLPEIERWLKDNGCEQDPDNLHCWYIEKPTWTAEISLEVEDLQVKYIDAGEGGADINRSFRYSLSRGDIEAAVFSGP
ncbi:MAG: DUF3143 domain-containing protein [Gomphosphaeria aponina SAG 52.96 = DSM 107014]|uniref:DUF3143 domain-containing protein n=1 Tax=Gomphosphaeria aponina SAG 52.96 = DSM 107014 TaxID=1521640 RepID=A0A941GSN4_9CHRO|nr:DUF3143 domain-containing protein [Gomphosphaeria aponina SAG 52.96 = DSM 107014]